MSRYILSDEESYSRVMPEESDSGFTPVTPAKVALILSMTSWRVMLRLSMEKVLPEIEKVPLVILEKIGRSSSAVPKLSFPANPPIFRFLDDISVLLARDSTRISKSPVRAPASADAEKPEEEEDMPTFLALNKSSFCKALAELLRVSSWLLRIPSSEIFSLFLTFSASSLCLGTDSSSISLSTSGCQSKPDARPVSFMSDPML